MAGEPFIFSGAGTCSQSAGGAITPGAFNVTNLVNTLTVPVEVSELRFLCVGAYAQQDTEISLQIGRWIITNQYCPLFVLDRLRDAFDIQGAISEAAGQVNVDTMRWILPRPLIVFPGEAFRGSVEFNASMGVVSVRSLTVTMTAIGKRVANTRPKARAIPYASGAYYTSTSPATIPSGKVFSNIFKVPLTINTINHRSATATVPTYTAGAILTAYGPQGLSDTNRRTITSLVHVETAMAERRSLEQSFVLDPNEMMSIMDYGSTSYTPDGGVAIGMSGYRMES